MIKVKAYDYDNLYRLTKTFWKQMNKEWQGYWMEKIDADTYVEFWEGRKFIGGLIGQTYWNEEIYVDRLLVNKRYRKKGYGRYIINWLKKNYDEVSLESTPEAFGFYKKLGFIKRKSQDDRIHEECIDMHFKKR